MKENKYYTHLNFFLPVAYVFALGLFFTEETQHVSGRLSRAAILLGPPFGGVWTTAAPVVADPSAAPRSDE